MCYLITHKVCYLITQKVCYLMLFGICPRTSSTPKLWYMYVITYSDYKVIVEPCKHWNLLPLMNSWQITNLRNKCFLVHSPAPALYNNYKLLDWSPLGDCHQEPLGDLSIQRKLAIQVFHMLSCPIIIYSYKKPLNNTFSM